MPSGQPGGGHNRPRPASRGARRVEAAESRTRPKSFARPPALRPGDRVAVLSISSPAEPEALAIGLDALRFAGLDPVVYPSATDQGTMRSYLAGDDRMRVADLQAALTDPGIAGIIFATGGSGSHRTLEAIDLDPIAAHPPTVLAGYSDVTAILEAVASKLVWASLYSPLVISGGGPFCHYSFA